MEKKIVSYVKIPIIPVDPKKDKEIDEYFSKRKKGLVYKDELRKLVDVAEQVTSNPYSMTAHTALKNAVEFYRDKGI